MNRLIRIGILWCLTISIVRAQEPSGVKEASKTPTLAVEQTSPLLFEPAPVNGQPSPFRPAKSEPPRRVAEPKRIVIQPGVDAQESEVAMQFMADLEKAGITKIDKTEMTPTSESPIVVQVLMREDESFEKIKLFLVDLRASGVEKLVLEFGGLHPEGYADRQHNGLVFRATKEYSQDELQRLEKVTQAAAERCGLSLYLAGTHVFHSGSEFVAPPKKAGVSNYAPSFRPTIPQLRIDYEAANKLAHELAESLRQTPDAAKKSELRTAVQRAFTLRQSLLRAESQEMHARLEKTQQSLDMRDRMADQIVDRRVEDLLNPELKWESDPPIESRPPSTLTSTAPSTPTTATPVTELEGDWHLVSELDEAGQPVDLRPANMTFKNDQYTLAYQGGQNDCRVEVYPDKKEIRYFKDDSGFFQDHYLLEGDQLTIYDDMERTVYQRGHVPLPRSIPAATDEQKSRWRSGIVDIYWEHHTPNEMRQDPVGKGVVISPKGLVICQVPEEIQSEKDPKTKFIVRFDDGGFAYTTIVEEADHGWLALQPTQPSNHQFPISISAMTIGDQVHLWACDSGGSPLGITVDLAKVILLDRKATTANTSVCQLTRPSDFLAHSCPVLSGDGELLAITLRGTGDLVLAVPVAELKTMFPKSFGPAAQQAE